MGILTPVARVGVDWNDDGFICWNAKVGDPLNVIPSAPFFHGMDNKLLDTLTIVGDESVIHDDGHVARRMKLGTGTAAAIYFGRDAADVTNDIPVVSGATYTFNLWLKGVANYVGVPMNVRIISVGSVQLAESITQELDTTWKQFTATFRATSTSFVSVLVRRASSTSSNTEFLMTGLMIVPGSTLPSYNAGNVSDLYENVEPYMESVSSVLGSKDNHPQVSPEGTLSVV